MKKIVYTLFLFSAMVQAQFTINGTMTTTLKTDWIILYKIEGVKQKFVQNTTIKKETILVDGNEQEIGTFLFQLPKDTPSGSYRITYKTDGTGFVEFIFNQENIQFTFHPQYPEETVLYSASQENILFKNYITQIGKQQQKVDSIQIIALKEQQLNLKEAYNDALINLKNIQAQYLESSKNMYVQPFIKAMLRTNPSELKTDTKAYLANIRSTFFNNMDFSDTTLINSSFLMDRIKDYIFYINYSEDKEIQQKLYKEAVAEVFSKIKDINFKKNVIELLIEEFEKTKNVAMIKALFKNYYNTLPKPLQNNTFKTTKLAKLASEIGSIAPDFSWEENDAKFQLSTLDEAENYVLVFWSAACSHCLHEIPVLYQFTKNNKRVKVIAFGMEKEAYKWKNMVQELPNWHHALGLNKWENKTARTYNINATPTYFVLDKSKKITAKPETLNDLKNILNNLSNK